MDTGLRVRDLTFGSLFKIMFSAALAFWVIAGLLLGALALAGFDTVSFNGSQIHGIGGLVVGFVIAVVIGGLFSALGAAFGALVLKLLGAVLPIGTLRRADRPPSASEEPSGAQ